jgi:gas vesicle protein
MSKYEEFDEEPIVVVEQRSAGIGSFLWGLANGAGLALLYAPRSGEETRRDLRVRARRARGAAQEAAEELGDSVVDQYQHARRSVEERIDSARRVIEIKKEQASQAIRAGREAAEQARRELEARLAETRAAYKAGADVARDARELAADAGEREPDDDERDAAGA